MIVRLQQFKPLASRCISIRHSSTSTSLINIRSIPAPHSGSIRVLSLNNPQTRNAISRALLTELASHINEIYTEGPQGSTRAVILASDIDTSFCAGADLKERRGFTLEEYAPNRIISWTTNIGQN